MKHITKKEVSRIRKRVQVRTQARKRASVIRDRKKNKSRRGVYTKKRKVMLGGNNIDVQFSKLNTPKERFDFATLKEDGTNKNLWKLSEKNRTTVLNELPTVLNELPDDADLYDLYKIKDLVKNRPANDKLLIAINKRIESINENLLNQLNVLKQQPQPQFNSTTKRSAIQTKPVLCNCTKLVSNFDLNDPKNGVRL
jgi:hypothetical protein